MNSAETLRWRQFFILSLKMFIAAWIITLIIHGFSQTIWLFGLKASAVVTLFSFFWVFCARDEKG